MDSNTVPLAKNVQSLRLCLKAETLYVLRIPTISSISS